MALSPTERERLINRPKDSKTRATNDVRVRRKLAAWLKDLDDIELIFGFLPPDQLKKELNDEVVFKLLRFAEIAMYILDFRPIEGDVADPDKWVNVAEDNTRKSVTDEDILRAYRFEPHVKNVEECFGARNPIAAISALADLDEDPLLHDKVNDGERRAIKKVQKIMDEYMDDVLGDDTCLFAVPNACRSALRTSSLSDSHRNDP
jgi:hypothetical protein